MAFFKWRGKVYSSSVSMLLCSVALGVMLLVGGLVGLFLWQIQDETPSVAERKIEQILSDPGFAQLVADLKNVPEDDLVWGLNAVTGKIVFKNGDWFVFSSYAIRDDDLGRSLSAVGKGSDGVWYAGVGMLGLRHRLKEMRQPDSLEAFLGDTGMGLSAYEP
jgi:hypothetical protein